MRFAPIAIVGRACVLPGALTPEALWTRLEAGDDLTSSAPDGRWRLSPEHALTDDPGDSADRAWGDRGGYVHGFQDVFDPTDYAVPAERLRGLDPLFHWVLHCGRQALREAVGVPDRRRMGAILGNLSFPSSGMARWAETVWLRENRLASRVGPLDADPRDRFMSGLPVQLLAEGLGVGGPAFALDAACASSLYAIKLACDRLHDRDADLMLAGAVNRSDDLFIHMGFSALQALSRSGRSRPFHADADGLLPAEGCVVFALKRLEDALADGDTVHGVIRGVALSNDGRRGGVLAPDSAGQVRCMAEAWRMAGLDPTDVGLLECHATGTPVGDKVELGSMAQVFGGGSDIAIGSIKSNMGHPITVAGAAGLLKVLGAMRAGVRPPSLHVDRPHAALEGSPFRVVHAAEPWPADAPRRAAVSAFGFGGNNAHIVVEAFCPRARLQTPTEEPPTPAIGVVAVSVRAAACTSTEAFARAALAGEDALVDGPRGREGRASEVRLALQGLRFPPKDLAAALPQQLMMLEVAREALEPLGALDRERTGVFVGMGADPEVVRYGARWRALGWADALGQGSEWAAAAREAVVPVLTSAGVIGTMPNIPANRLNHQFDVGGPGFTISSEESSGIDALAVAVRALQAGELDVTLVGAVDLCCQPAHAEAARALGLSSPDGDAAVALVLQRVDDARAAGRPLLAVLGGDGDASSLRLGEGGVQLGPMLGHAHAASGLLHVAAGVLACARGVRPEADGPAPWTGTRHAHVRVRPLGGTPRVVGVSAAWVPVGLAPVVVPRVLRFAGADRRAVLARLSAGTPGGEGPARLAIVAGSEGERASRLAAAHRVLSQGHSSWTADGMAWREHPVGGGLGFVFSGAGAARSDTAVDLLVAMPELCADGVPAPSECEVDTPLGQLVASTSAALVHTALARKLGLRPLAAVGCGTGEIDALLGMGAWLKPASYLDDLRHSFLWDRLLVGARQAVAHSWGTAEPGWACFTVNARVEAVQRALAKEPRAYLLWIQSPTCSVVGGREEVLLAALRRVPGVRVTGMAFAPVLHAPETAAVAETWMAVHRRPTRPVPGVAFYRGSDARAYAPTRDAVAQSSLQMATSPVDVRRVVTKAWEDGVRVFVDVGAGGRTAGWIREILVGKAHLAVAFDTPGRSAIAQAQQLAAEVWAAGVDVDSEALEARLTPPAPDAPARALVLPAHWPLIRLPAVPDTHEAVMSEPSRPAAPPQPMPRAPELPSVSVPVPTKRPSTVPRAAAQGSEAPVLDGASLLGGGTRPTIVRLPEEVAAAASAAGSAVLQPRGPVMILPRDEPEPVEDGPARRTPGTAEVHEELGRGGSIPLSGVVRFAEDHASVVSAHKRYAASRAEMHSRFLASQREALQAFTRAAAQRGIRLTDGQPLLAEGVEEAPTAAPPEVTRPVGLAAERGRDLPGPKLDRHELEIHASGRISQIFGPLFERQDAYVRQVRMPEPPLLLADRMIGLDAEPGVLGKGTLWTETDVTEDAWYLHGGRMPAGVMIEAGQADLMLISYMGIDFFNRGERAYRLLGCELTYHGELPRVGETLTYDIHVDGHAQHGDVRLFFFHYDCRVDGELRLSVRGGQAGFFSEAELADSAGILWRPETGAHTPEARVDPPAVACGRTRFDRPALEAWASGDAFACFGAGFELARTHNDTPRIQGGRMLFFDEVTELSPRGGPWGRGHLRAVHAVSPDDWTFQGHFKNDPCMPGTLMFEGCLQALAVFLTAEGHTIDKDGWRFQPVPGQAIPMRCRGQVLPTSSEVVYEIFVDEVVAGPIPTIYADLLCTVDGLKAFHARRCGLQLVPGWPLDHLGGRLLADHVEPGVVAEADGVRFDYRALLACAWGRPSEAFGSMYAKYDGPGYVARLPGPPYHFMSRVTHVHGEIGSDRAGMRCTVEYDIPEDAWYFDENGAAVMPFAVLLEAALQPCGWLASYAGSAARVDHAMYFRNLDGTGTLMADLTRRSGTLRTEVTLTNIARSAGMIIDSFDVQCFLGDTLVYDLKTVFGFFPAAALANQRGITATAEERARLVAPGRVVDLTLDPVLTSAAGPHLAGSMLRMIDRVTFYDPGGGAAGLGRLRSEKQVDPGEWFFKAHFFQDPVQPGSLGIEAMVQLLQLYMIDRDLAAGMTAPRFEGLATHVPHTWTYRGQVVPKNRLILVDLEVTAVERDEHGVVATAVAFLWVDDLKIYGARGLAVRIVDGPVPGEELVPPAFVLPEEPPRPTVSEARVDLQSAPWVADHCPTFTVPVLPMMDLADRMAAAAAAVQPGRDVVALGDVRVERWVRVGPEGTRIRTEATVVAADLVEVRLWAAEGEGAFALAAAGRVHLGGAHPEPPPALPPIPAAVTRLISDPYASGQLFHGPAFQYQVAGRLGGGGASTELDAGAGTVPAGLLRPGLLDASTHGIPHDRLDRWSRDISADQVAYPQRILSLRLYGALPTRGRVRVEARFRGLASPSRALVAVQLIADDVVLAEYDLEEALLPKGPLGRAEPAERRAFLRDRIAVPGLSLSRVDGDRTELRLADVVASDWLPGTVAGVYGVRGSDLVREVALRDHAASRLGVHPSRVWLRGDVGSVDELPLAEVSMAVEAGPSGVQVTGEAELALQPVAHWWRKHVGVGAWPVEDVFFTLLDRFVDWIHLPDPEAFDKVAGRGVVFVSNHQVAIESIWFSVVASALLGVPTTTLAKTEHRASWLGQLLSHAFSWPGVADPSVVAFFDRANPAEMTRILTGLEEDLRSDRRAVMVHVDGTRALQAGQPVHKMSSVVLDMALRAGAPVVPVRFTGGLPVEPAPARLDFPVGFGRQDLWIGAPIDPETLRGMHYRGRVDHVLDAINALGPEVELPHPADPPFVARVEAWRASSGAAVPHAVLLQTMLEAEGLSPWTQRLVDAVQSGELRVPRDARGSWLVELAERMFGSRLPSVVWED